MVSKLRGAVREAGLDRMSLASDGASYELVGEDGDVDIRDARRRARDLTTVFDVQERLASAARVLATTERSFLSGDDDPWIVDVRRELLRLRAVALEAAAVAHVAVGAPETAIRLLGDLLEIDRYRESAHRALMEAHLAAGNRARAVQVHGRLRSMLADELAIDPSPETEAAYLAVLRESGTPTSGRSGRHPASSPRSTTRSAAG
ncbi:MAG: bacterial transcriptional activator domain-containing protein [Ornithinimicrobium sp.]